MQTHPEIHKHRRRRLIQFIFVIIIVVMTSVWLHRTAKDTWATGVKISKLRRTLSTHTTVCTDLRHIGGQLVNQVEKGARDICFDPEIRPTPGNCLVYSFGVNRDWSFDKHMANLGCQIHAFDPLLISRHKPKSLGNLIKLHNIVLGCEDEDGVEIPQNFNTSHALSQQYWHKRTLSSIIKSLGHNRRTIDILHLDIGTDVMDILPTMLKDGSLTRHVRQLVCTVHIDTTNLEELRKHNKILEMLALQGFKLFNQNICKHDNQILDLSFLNEWMRNT